MPDPIQALLGLQGGDAPFPPSSRYHGVPTATLETPRGPVVYLRRRFVPPPDRLAPLGAHTVREGDRLDLVAAAALGDPELFWRIADANGAMRPDALETPGRRLRITLPDGLPGPADG